MDDKDNDSFISHDNIQSKGKEEPKPTSKKDNVNSNDNTRVDYNSLPFNIVDFSYDYSVVSFSVIIFVLHMIDYKGAYDIPWKVYIIAPLTMWVSLTILFKAVITLIRLRVFLFAWRNTVKFYNGTMRYSGIMLSYINANKFSKVIWTIAIMNLGLILFWCFVNIHIFRAFFDDLGQLIINFFCYISDPVKILNSLNQFLNRLGILSIINSFKKNYFDYVIAEIYVGNYGVIFKIIFMSVILVGCGLVPHIFYNIFVYGKDGLIELIHFLRHGTHLKRQQPPLHSNTSNYVDHDDE